MVGPKKDPSTLENIQLLTDVAYVRDGHHRLPTAKKHHVTALVRSNEEKRRLGKQQQLLNDIALRCREQEVQDLTGGLTRKVNFTSGQERRLRDFSFYSSQYQRHPSSFLTSQNSPLMSQSENSLVLSLERGHTMFPLRSPIRSPARGIFSLPRLPHTNHNTVRDSKINHTLYLHAAPKRGQPTARSVVALPGIKYYDLRNRKHLESYIKAKAVPFEEKSKTPSSLDRYSSAGMGKGWRNEAGCGALPSV